VCPDPTPTTKATERVLRLGGLHLTARSLRDDAEACWRAGLACVDACEATRAALAGWEGAVPDLILATGKAAVAMATAARERFPTAAIEMLTVAGIAAPLPAGARLRIGSHPEPSPEGIAHSRELLARASALGAGGHLLYLLSGGSSALFEVPREGVSEDDLIATHTALVASGLAISEINRVRRALSAVKGGGLTAAARPARVTTLAVSDVAGDTPAVIGSGPTIEEPFDGEALGALLDRMEAQLPPAVRRFLRRVASAPGGGSDTTVASADTFLIVASAADAARGAAAKAAALIGSGETVVELGERAGRGGRNLHLALVLADRLQGREGWACVSAGTDGRDGNSGVAGALVDGATAARVVAGYGPVAGALERFDSGAALAAAGDCLETGATGTNVGDLAVLLVAPRAGRA
jgi:glycerate 2-kinase